MRREEVRRRSGMRGAVMCGEGAGSRCDPRWEEVACQDEDCFGGGR